MTNLYAILGLTPNAELTDIRAAYRTLAKQCHPDVVKGREEEFAELKEAHDVLTDPDERAFYDQTGTVRGKRPEGADNAEVMNFAAQLLNGAMQEGIEGSSLPKTMHRHLQQFRVEINRNIGAKEGDRKRLEKVKNRFKAKEGQENVFGKLLGAQIAEIDMQIARAKEQLTVMDKVAKLIDQHDYEVDAKGKGPSMSMSDYLIMGRLASEISSGRE